MFWPAQWLIVASKRLIILALLLGWGYKAFAQDPGGAGAGLPSAYGGLLTNLQQVTVTIGVRDARGLPLDELASVHLTSRLRGVNRISETRESANVSFQNLLEGPYDVLVECAGYRPVQQHLEVTGGSAFFTAYIYLHTFSDPNMDNAPPKDLAVSPKQWGKWIKGTWPCGKSNTSPH